MLVGDPTASVKMDVVLDGLVEDLVRVRAYHREAHQAATLVMAEQLVRLIDRNFADHHDTNRYINGWIGALHDIGIDRVPLKAYRRSDRHEHFVDRLEEQYKQTAAIADRYRKWIALNKAKDLNAPPRKDGKPRAKVTDRPSHRRLERKLRQAEKREQRAFESLAAAINNESVLFIHGRRGRKLKSGKYGLSRLHEARTRIYGGSGSLSLLGEQVIVELRNLEPHSRIIDARPGYGFPYKTSMNQLRAVGLKRVSKRYIKRQSELFNRRIVSGAEIRAANAKRHTILFGSAA